MRLCFSLAALLAMSGCATYSVEQSSMVPLPTAPPPAPMSGRGALELGASIAPEVEGGATTAASGLAVPLAQPQGALSVRVADFLVLRAYGGVALPQGATQVTGTIPAPAESAWFGGIGPVLRILAAERLLFFDIGLSVGFAVIPSTLHITSNDACSSDIPPVCRTTVEQWREVMPLFALGTDFGVRPIEWLQLRVGATVRNQPTNEAQFSRGGVPGSSVSAGPIGVVVHAGLQLDVIDELGVRADVEWPAVNLGLAYGPIVTLGVQGRIGSPGRSEPIGLEP
jgi:hypothetical protein